MALYDKNHLRKALFIPLVSVLITAFLHLLRMGLNIPAQPFGVFPRDTSSLIGILTSPLIHGDMGHLLSNILPLFAGLGVILLFYQKTAFKSILSIYVLTGLSVWLFGRQVYHIGASGVVYGLISFIFWSGIFRRSLKSIMLALIVMILYSGMLIGVFPIREGVSWESHLFGVVVGVIVAYAFRGEREADEIETPYDWELEEEKEESFFKPGTFDDI